MAGPLEGIRILDLTRDVAGPYATKLLADYGAAVLKVEPPEGDPSRRFGPFHGDDPHPEKSALFLHLNTNKRSITLDVEASGGAELVRRLAAKHDVVIEDFAPGEAEAWGFGWGVLAEGHDGLVMASITPFGQSGPYRDYRGSEITLQAMGGPLLNTGHRDMQPLKLAGHVAHYHAGAAAALAVMLARFRVETGGEGDYIDLSVYECQAGFRDRRTIFLTGAAYTGIAHQRPRPGTRPGAGVRPASDGYVNVLGLRDRPAMLEMIERRDLLEHPDIGKPLAQLPEKLMDEIEGSYVAWLLDHTKSQVVERAQQLHILSAAILTTEDLVNDAHYRGRGVWEAIDHPYTGPIEYPGRPMIMSASPRPAPRRAPLLGEHNTEVYVDELGLDPSDLTLLRRHGVI